MAKSSHADMTSTDFDRWLASDDGMESEPFKRVPNAWVIEEVWPEGPACPDCIGWDTCKCLEGAE
jgi:hypothetical protein